MAILTVKPLWEGRTGSIDYQRRRTYTRTFEVWTNDPYDDANTAGTHADIPELGESHPEDAAAVCISLTPTQSSESPLLWVVAAEYDTQPPQTAEAQQPATTTPPGPPSVSPPGEMPEDPLDRPPVWKGSFQQSQEVVSRWEGVDPTTGALLGGGAMIAVKNSAGLPFDPPVMVDRSYPIASVTFNSERLNFRDLELLQDAVNNVAFWGFGARVLRVVGVEWGSRFENNKSFWEITVHFAINYQTWDRRVLDAGYAVKATADVLGDGNVVTYLKKIKDPYGNEATEPQPLDGNGNLLTVGDPEVYIRGNPYPRRNFADLIPPQL